MVDSPNGRGDASVTGPEILPAQPCDDASVMRLWRECGLPEWFLGNGGTNHKLVNFAARVRMEAGGFPAPADKVGATGMPRPVIPDQHAGVNAAEQGAVPRAPPPTKPRGSFIARWRAAAADGGKLPKLEGSARQAANRLKMPY